MLGNCWIQTSEVGSPLVIKKCQGRRETKGSDSNMKNCLKKKEEKGEERNNSTSWQHNPFKGTISRQFQFKFKLPSCPFLVKQIESLSTGLEKRSMRRPGWHSGKYTVNGSQSIFFPYIDVRESQFTLINYLWSTEIYTETACNTFHVVIIYYYNARWNFSLEGHNQKNNWMVWLCKSGDGGEHASKLVRRNI